MKRSSFLPLDEQARGYHLEIAMVNETSGLEQIRRLHSSVLRFLDYQPRRLVCRLALRMVNSILTKGFPNLEPTVQGASGQRHTFALPLLRKGDHA